MFPFVKTALAATIDQNVSKLYYGVNKYLINPIIFVLFSIATVLFVIGLIEFLARQSDETAREKGKQHMLWGIIGLAIMATAVAIKDLLFSIIASVS